MTATDTQEQLSNAPEASEPETPTQELPGGEIATQDAPMAQFAASTQDHEQQDHPQQDHEPHAHAAPLLNPELTRTIEVEAPASDVDQAFRQILRRYSKMARIPGFRAGKVPESLIRSRFAKDVRQEVLDSLVSERFRTALEQGSMHPVSQPQVSELQLFEGQPLRFKATFEIAPEVNIDGYDSVAVQRPDVTVSDDEYNAELQAVLDHHGTVEPVEEKRPLAGGDWAEISFKGQVQEAATPQDETAPEAAAPQLQQPEQPEIKGDAVLLEVSGKNTLPAFTDALRGADVGQELQFEVDYPADFGDARLAGKTVRYDLKVNAIKRKTYPERDAEFAKQLGNYESWEAFEGKLREQITERKKDSLETEARDRMLEELIARFQFPVPETFVQQQIDARLDRGLRALAQQGMTNEAMRQLDFGRLRAAQRDQAIAEVKASLILDRIAERENVNIAEDELERELLMASIQAREPLETLRKRLTEDGSLERIREQMRREKTGAALYEKLAA